MGGISVLSGERRGLVKGGARMLFDWERPCYVRVGVQTLVGACSIVVWLRACLVHVAMHVLAAEVSSLDIAAFVCAFGRGTRTRAAISCLASERWDLGCFVRRRFLDERNPVSDRCWQHGTALCAMVAREKGWVLDRLHGMMKRDQASAVQSLYQLLRSKTDRLRVVAAARKAKALGVRAATVAEWLAQCSDD
eukprot:7385426-Prymnesium_polylepis.1